MRISAGGQTRFHGWHRLMDRRISETNWSIPRQSREDVSITFHNVLLQLNGHYKLNVTITREDVMALTPFLLSKDDLLALAELTDEDRIALARGVADSAPLGTVARSLAANLLPKDELIELAGLTSEDKIALAYEVLADMPFAQAIQKLMQAPNDLDDTDEAADE